MFDLPVAQAVFQHLCAPPTPLSQQEASSSSGSSSQAAANQQDPQQLAAVFAALKKPRESRVTEEQRQMMYTQLTAEMNALPPVFIRTADCQIQPLVQQGEQQAGLVVQPNHKS